MAVRNLIRKHGPRKDITGQRFGRWTVLSFAGNSFWNCRCDCGIERTIRGPHLKGGHSRSCGCFKGEAASERFSAKLEGRRFGKLIVIERVPRALEHGYHALWRCRCDCGKETTLQSGKLLGGQTRSCGCYFLERVTTHGASRTATYKTWIKIKGRCENPNQKSYANYGGRGIKVCDRWREYTNFLADMGPRPSDAHSIDRIDPNGNYEPANCRWSTKREQMRNTRRNKVVTVDGVEMHLTEAIEMLRKMARKKHGG